MKLLEYKGYYADVHFDPEDQIISGQLVGISDLVTFHTEYAGSVMTEFKNAVDDYLAFCAEIPKEPEKPDLGTGKPLDGLTPSQLYNLGKLAVRAKYNADHIRDKATEDERRNIMEKADALAAALRLATEVSEGENGR